MTNGSTTQIIETLAAEIGDKIYIDIAGWHLYLSDAKLHTSLAEKFYPILINQVPSEAQVRDILNEITVKLGAGRNEVFLTNLLPVQCEINLIEILEEFKQKM